MKTKKKTSKRPSAAKAAHPAKRPITFRFTGEQEKQLRRLTASFGGTMQSTIIQLVTSASPRALKAAGKKAAG